MKGFLKLIFRVLFLLIIYFVVFYFWASSSTLNDSDYVSLVKVDVQNQPKNDSVFSIITYNIGCLSGMTNNRPIAKPKSLFDENMQKVLAETKKVNPTIIAFQEIDYDAKRSYNINQEGQLANLGFPYRARTVN
jgi:mRNA deadenylase 3'-5' endonuclease subunit Ccr4